MKNTLKILPALAFCTLNLAAQVDLTTAIDFNDSAGTDAGAAAATNNFFSNTPATTGFATDGSGRAVWKYDLAAAGSPDLYKARNFSTAITDTNYSSVTLQFKIDFNLINPSTKTVKLGFGLMDDTDKVAEIRVAQITNGQVRPEYVFNNANQVVFIPSDNSLTNWGINTNNNGITMTATLDFQNDTATFSYNNANNSDGDVTIFTGSYTGSSINKLRITAVGNDLFTDGDGAYLSVDDLTISAVAVPEPSQVALAIAILSFGAVILRRKGSTRLSN